MSLLILLRHGQSHWNQYNRFTGWVDIPLSTVGIQEAQAAGQKIAKLPIDHVFTSALIRSQMTAMIAMAYHESGKVARFEHVDGKMGSWAACYDEEALAQTIPVTSAWELNERYYGKLQGLNKQATMDKYGKDQVQLWRRSYAIAPPDGESLKDTALRTLPYFRNTIIPHLQGGKNIFVCAHGNSLRSIIMDIERLSEDQVVNLELSTGEPIIYEYVDGAKFVRK